MPYELPPLPYDYNALEPTIDEQTMRIHHGKHHQAYVDNLNKALDGTEWDGRPLEQVLALLDVIPEDKRAAVRNNGGGHANHSLFWQLMKPGGGEPSGTLADAIDDTFGDVAQLKTALNDGGVKRFGSGWTMAHLGRHRPRARLDAEPGLPADDGRRAAPRHRRLGARLLPQIPESAARLPCRLVGRRQLGRSREPVRSSARGLSPARRFARLGELAVGDRRADRAEEARTGLVDRHRHAQPVEALRQAVRALAPTTSS